MSEIKFRAWDKLNGRWIETEFLGVDGDGTVRSDLGLDFDKYGVLMQYTGLKDKNGREIYEGDVVRNDDGRTGCVEYFTKLKWDMGCPHPGFYCQQWFRDGDLSYHDHFGSVEVIGNIYENPELL